MEILYNRIITCFKNPDEMELFRRKFDKNLLTNRLFYFPKRTIFKNLSTTEQKLYLTTLTTSRIPKEPLSGIYEELNGSNGVEYVQYDQTFDLYATRPTEDLNAWWFNAANCQGALSTYTSPNTPVSVAVIDSGINHRHADMGDKVVLQRDFNNLEWTDSGWRNPNGDLIRAGDRGDNDWHGTHVAGIIGALRSGTFTVGVAHQTKLLNLRAYPNATEASLCAVFDYAIRNMNKSINGNSVNMRVINASWGTTVTKENAKVGNTLESVIKRACEKGIIVVCAAGNNNDSVENYVPAKFDNVIAVGSLKRGAVPNTYVRADDSNYGPNVVGAPGVSILSLNANDSDSLLSGSGTSMATGFVSGLVARMIEKRPSLLDTSPGAPCNKATAILAAIKTKPITQETAKPIGRSMIDVDETLKAL